MGDSLNVVNLGLGTELRCEIANSCSKKALSILKKALYDSASFLNFADSARILENSAQFGTALFYVVWNFQLCLCVFVIAKVCKNSVVIWLFCKKHKGKF